MAPSDHSLVLWRLRGHGRDVRCVRQDTGQDLELRVLWGQQLFLTEAFDEEPRLRERAREIRASLRARGWQPLPDDEDDVPPAGDIEDVLVGTEAEATTHLVAGRDPLFPADPGRRPTVLVVDHDAGVRKVLRSYLEQAGYAVCEAGDVEAGLDALGDPAVDAVVLDLQLPDPMGWGRSGLDVLAFIRLHAASAALPVLVVADRRPEPEEHDLIRRQRADIFLKAAGYPSLLDRLDQVTGRRELNREGGPSQ